MRNLASIQIVEELNPIPGADKIEVATVLGWKCVVKKGDFIVGDKCIYIEIDSVLPDRPEFEFMRDRKFRVKTIRLRGQISQGLLFPTSLLKKPQSPVGTDVTEELGITKYEPYVESNHGKQQRDKYVFPRWFPISIRRFLVRRTPWLARIVVILLPKKTATRAKTWPSLFPKTDETRVQILKPVLAKYAGTECRVTEKLDGSSITVFNYNGKFGVCSRNLQLDSKDNVWWEVALKYNIEKHLPHNIALQGEVIGPNIQGNKYLLTERDVYFFNGYNIAESRYMSDNELAELLFFMNLKWVPKLGTYSLTESVDDIVQLSIGKSNLNETVWREGIVVRPVEDIYDYEFQKWFQGNRVSFKAINPEFLLKYGE